MPRTARTMTHRSTLVGLALWGCLALQAPTVHAQKLRAPSASPAPARLAPATPTPPSTPAARPPAEADGVRLADYIVAVVNSEPLTNHEVRARMLRTAQTLQGQGQALPPQETLAREVLERLILEKILLQQAREQGVRVDDYAVDQALHNVARQNEMTLEQMQRRMRTEGIDPKAFRDDLRQQLLLQRLRERELEARVRVSDVEIDQYLQEQRQRAGAAAATQFAVNLGHILVRVPEDASPAVHDAAQARAQEVAQKAQAPGADFAALAREFSEAPEGRQGGALGLRAADRYPELFVQALGKAGTGQVLGPVRSAAGFHILKVLERTSAGVAATVVQNHARHILLRTHAQLSERAAVARLLDYRQRVRARQDSFEALAREHSEDGSAAQGGDLGWATPGRYVPEFEQALATLQPGQISEPVVSRFGVHLIQLVERREVPLTAREQRDLARDAVREKKWEEAYTTWAQEQRAHAYVEYREPPQQ